MTTYVEIPTSSGRAFTETVTLQGVTYKLNFNWNGRASCWVLDFYDETGATAILCGVPLVTGADLLEQFGYMPLGAHAVLLVMTIGPALSPDTVPTFNNLGSDGHLYLAMPP